MLKFSIITVCYNSEKFIEETINSVISQTYKNIEYIVIDGNSTDNTAKIIRRYIDYIDFFLCESDNSMYEAINKGIKKSSGDYIAILNSDDFYCNSRVIEELAKILSKNRMPGLYGNRVDVDVNGIFLKRKKTFNINFKFLLLSRHLTIVGHPCLFLSKKVIDNVGLYDEKFFYASDLDYVLRCLRDFKLKHCNLDIVSFRLHNESITSSGKIDSERRKILTYHGFQNYALLERCIFFAYVWGKYFLNNPKNFKKNLSHIMNIFISIGKFPCKNKKTAPGKLKDSSG